MRQSWTDHVIVLHAFLWLVSLQDKTIKLWKITEKSQQAVDFNNVTEDPTRPLTELRVPKYQSAPLTVEAVERRTYANAHAYHINSVSLSSDVATFLSADDLRINLWNIENNKECFSILLVLSPGDCNALFVMHFVSVN